MILLVDEDLIKWGWPEDVWFHVDKYSSAHVYLRLRHVSPIINEKPPAWLKMIQKLIVFLKL